jgi:hypothetical protein
MFERRETSLVAGAESAIRLLARLRYLARNLAIKVALRRRWSRLPKLLGHNGQDYPY